jgi:serine/threonine protein kinase
MGHSPGTKLGPYEIEAPIGAGGMGEVYRAKDTRLCREVAIEVLPNSLTQDGDRLRCFEQEAKAVAALNHPNILGIHDIGEQDGSNVEQADWSPDGSEMAVITGNSRELTMQLEYAIGKVLIPATGNWMSRPPAVPPAITPDGSKMMFGQRKQLSTLYRSDNLK